MAGRPNERHHKTLKASFKTRHQEHSVSCLESKQATQYLVIAKHPYKPQSNCRKQSLQHGMPHKTSGTLKAAHVYPWPSSHATHPFWQSQYRLFRLGA